MKVPTKKTKIPLVVFGAGGHAGVVLDIICLTADSTRTNVTSRLIFVEDDPKNDQFKGFPLKRSCSAIFESFRGKFEYVVAVGDNAFRAEKFAWLESFGGTPITVIHPKAVISPNAQIGAGTVICANAVVNVDAIVGQNCIINTGAIVEHDCLVASHVHICSNAALAGAVIVQGWSMIGTGASVIPKIVIGSGTVVGAGSVVVRDLPNNVTAYGNPARIKR